MPDPAIAVKTIEFSAFQAVVEFVKTVGFPIAVALWFMFRSDKKVDKNTDVTLELKEAVYKLLEEVRKRP